LTPPPPANNAEPFSLTLEEQPAWLAAASIVARQSG
jgi:hypothetical protein